MKRRRLSVRDLALEAGVEFDEVLVTLWGLGIEDVLRPSDPIPRAALMAARTELGVASRHQLRSLDYWRELLALSPEEIRQLMVDHGIAMSSLARRLPPGAVSRLKAISRERGIDPLVGTIRDRRPRVEPASVQAGGEQQGQVELSELSWEPHGHVRELKWLSTDEVLQIHFALADDYAGTDDPIVPVGPRNGHLLASALSRPQTCNGGTLKYWTIEAAAAALLHALILDHPFHNGNKRTALVSTLVFLDRNGMLPTCADDDLFRLVLQVAQHRMAAPSGRDLADREVLAINAWFCDRTRLVRKGENPLPWRRLRRQLTALGCELEIPGTVGNRMNITRKVKRKGLFGRMREQSLQTQVFYGDEGRDVDISTIKKIREDLELDDEHGVDSLSFYSTEPASVAEFITRYRKTLDRLARL